ncbi:MAG TPA: DUF2934 domain-containing protein [Terracidiphilus sp.]|jgi:hypothetical protein|nr:DUF2934 domain-containing protein [Terracidiphilus sp.]
MPDSAKKAAPRKPRAAAAVQAKTAETAPKKTAAAKKEAAPKSNGKVKHPVSRQEIAALAHRFWLERGGHHGHDAEDWQRAERTLLGKAS